MTDRRLPTKAVHAPGDRARKSLPEQGPTYEGRPFARPNEEVVDQGVAFDLATLMDRRRLFRTLGLGAAAVGLAACGSSATGTPAAAAASTAPANSATAAVTSAAVSSSGTLSGDTSTTEIPDETAGPYPGDGSNGPDVLQSSGIVRGDLRSSFGGATGTAQGVPLALELQLVDIAQGGAPFAGAAVYVWHCDREGRYSLYTDGVTEQNYLRGVQIADAAGVVSFSTIFPACYSGRWPHIHFEVYPNQAAITNAANAVSTSQVALPQAVCEQVYAQPGYEASVANLARVSLKSDGVFGDDAGVSQLAAITADVAAGFAATLRVGVDTTTAPTATAGMGGGPGGAGGSGGAGGPAGSGG